MDSGARCSICGSKDRDAIETALVERRTYDDIADEFGVKARTVRRHNTQCIPGIITRARNLADVRHADAICERFLKHLEKCESLLGEAEVERDAKLTKLTADMTEAQSKAVVEAAKLMSATRRETLRTLSVLRPMFETFNRLAGNSSDSVNINLFQAPQFLAAKEVIVTALAKHPEAKLDVLDALNELAAQHEIEGNSDAGASFH